MDFKSEPRIQGRLGMMASCRAATELFDLPPNSTWEKIREGEQRAEWTIVPVNPMERERWLDEQYPGRKEKREAARAKFLADFYRDYPDNGEEDKAMPRRSEAVAMAEVRQIVADVDSGVMPRSTALSKIARLVREAGF